MKLITVGLIVSKGLIDQFVDFIIRKNIFKRFFLSIDYNIIKDDMILTDINYNYCETHKNHY